MSKILLASVKTLISNVCGNTHLVMHIRLCDFSNMLTLRTYFRGVFSDMYFALI